MAPLTDAMGLIDGKQTQGILAVKRIEQGQKSGRCDSFGGGVKQRDFASAQTLLDRLSLVHAQGRVEKGSANTGLVKCPHLIVHQGNEGRHHNGDAKASVLSCNGRNLIAKAFAAACGHEHQGVLTSGDMLNDVALGPSKRLIAKDLAENA